jgi:hypothetical protein
LTKASRVIYYSTLEERERQAMKITVDCNGEAISLTISKKEWDSRVRDGYAAMTLGGPQAMVCCPKTDAIVLVPAILACEHEVPLGCFCDDCEAEYEEPYDCPIHGLQISNECPLC